VRLKCSEPSIQSSHLGVPRRPLGAQRTADVHDREGHDRERDDSEKRTEDRRAL
jgi:hypothetical protein